jgi:hypothetical protein
MAHTEQITPKDLAFIADQIARFWPAGLADVYAREPPPMLAEHLPMVVLAYDRLTEGRGPLRERVRRTGQWHCQIKRGDAAKDYATTKEPAADNPLWQVVAVGRSALPARLDMAISWVEKHARGDPMVRLLYAPSHDVTALWLEQPDRDEVVVALAPKAYAKLRTEEVLAGDSFLEILSGYKPIVGVPLGRTKRRRPPRPS